MSSAARDEAIAIVTDELVVRHLHPSLQNATEIVDKLLETHTIVRRAPRLHRATRSGTPVTLAKGQLPTGRSKL